MTFVFIRTLLSFSQPSDSVVMSPWGPPSITLLDFQWTEVKPWAPAAPARRRAPSPNAAVLLASAANIRVLKVCSFLSPASNKPAQDFIREKVPALGEADPAAGLLEQPFAEPGRVVPVQGRVGPLADRGREAPGLDPLI